MKTSKLNLLSALLFVAAMAFGTNAFAQTFDIQATYYSNTHKTLFTITRSGSSLPAQTINFRTVNLSAYAGQHYMARIGTRTFTADQTTDTVMVREKAANNVEMLYRYQNGTTRTYRFEVLDVNGYELAHKDRSISYGNTYQHTDTYVNSSITDLLYFNGGSIYSGSGNKYRDVAYDPSSNSSHVMSGSYIKIDDGYDYDDHTLCNISTSSLYGNKSGLRDYLNTLGYKMYATVYFTMKEEDDGYQYIQILADNSTTKDGKDPDGGVNDPSTSLYKACFELSKGTGSNPGTVTADHYQVFPHRYDCHSRTDCSQTSTHTEFEYADSYLYAQKYQSSSYNATNSGSLVLATTVNTINVRFDANGSGDDTWYLKNLKARLAFVDATKPTLLSNNPKDITASITVSAGPYVKGNTFYVSVPFKEIVTVTDSPTLTNNWGTLSYTSGSGSNVLTFMGTITDHIGSALTVSGLSGTVKDLAGNSFTWPSVTSKTFSNAVSSATYTLAATNTEFTGFESEYVVNTTAIEPHPTVYFYKGKKVTANQVQLAETTDYTLSWSNNNTAGNGTVTATGTGSYTGSASATFPIRWSTYTFRFHDNGSVGIPVTGEMSDQVFQYGVAQNLTANAFSREGFTFARWNTQPDGNGTAYTDGQSIVGLTTEDGAVIDLYAQWTVIPWTGTGDDSNNPYFILYASQLDSLAATVNSGTTYQNKFFKLGADITYAPTTLWNDANSTENNYTAIGTSTNNFRGTFDGDNHTISGIRIYNTDDNQGLFGYADYATIKNVILTDARITCYNDVGGIAGYIHYLTTIQSCLVSNAAIIGNDKVGAVVGYKFSGTDHLIYNYYLGCIVKKGSTTYYTGIGLGDPMGDYPGEVASLHTLNPSDNITANGESVVIDNATYYASNTTITLGYTETINPGYKLGYTYNDGTAHAVVGNTFEMPGADITVSATFTDVWGIAGGATGSETHPYIISDTTGLNVLAKCVIGTHGYTANWFYQQFFKLGADITYCHTTDWNDVTSTENNYTAIGKYNTNFRGTFDGDGHTVSGIRIYKGGNTESDDYQGLFGYVSNATIKNLILTDTRITGRKYVGGITGFSYADIDNCCVTGSVAIHAVVDHANWHGGIVGHANGGSISGCSSAATVTIANGLTGCELYGSIVGYCNSHLQNCLVVGGTVSGNSYVGAIAGYFEPNSDYSLTNNYYTSNNNGGVNGSDCDGARRARTITLGEHVGIAGDQTEYDVSVITAIGTTALSYNNGTTTTIYSGATQTVTLSVEEGYALIGSYTVKDANNNDITLTDGDTFEMPASDVTVSASVALLPEVSVSNSNQTVCLGNSIETMEITAVNATITSVDDLPAGLTWSGTTITGIPEASGTATVTVTSDQGPDCGTATATVTITVKPLPEVTVTNSSQTVCLGNSIEHMEITAVNATITSVEGLPAGLTWSGTMISGIPEASGTATVMVFSNQTPECGTASATVTINVNPLPEVTVTNSSQTVCLGNSIETMEITATNGTIANVEGLPAGLTWSGTTISGIPTETGTFNATVTVSSDQTPGCGTATATISLTVNPLPELSLTNADQTVYIDQAIADIEITATNAVVTSVTGLPTGVNWSGYGGTTISGTPVQTGTFDVTVIVTSTCGCDKMVFATITVDPVPMFTKGIVGYGDDNNVKTGWHLMASPVSTPITPTEENGFLANTFDLYRFNQAADAEWENWKADGTDHYHFDLVSGRGYLYANSEDVTLTFSGIPYSGNGVIPLERSNDNPDENMRGWNLVGNPFTENAYIELPFYIMNDQGSEIIAAGNRNYIEPMEGVFVHAEENGEKLTFTTEAPSKGRGQSPEQIVIDLSPLNSHLSTSTIDRAIVRFGEGRQLPKLQIFEDSPKLYIPQAGKEYAIAVIASGSEAIHSGEIPVHFKAKENGDYTLTVSTPLTSQFSVLYLIDNIAGQDIDLLQTQSYTFTARNDDYASRFKLVFSANENDNENDDFAFISNGEIIVNGEGTLQVIDALGRILFNKEITTANCQLPTSNYKPGVYVLQLINGENVKTQKIVIR